MRILQKLIGFPLIVIAIMAVLAIKSDIYASSNGLVISQIFANGGETGSTYKHDYVEIFNTSTHDIALAGFAVQHALLPTTPWSVIALPNTTLEAGQYFLIQMAPGKRGKALPTPDMISSYGSAPSRGRFAITNSTTPLSGRTPLADGDATIVDFVGYGKLAEAIDYETTPIPPLVGNIAIFRMDMGCTDTNDNSADFHTGTPAPRNTATLKNICGGVADAPPEVKTTTPAKNAKDVAIDTDITVTFSEGVSISDEWYTIICSLSGLHTGAVSSDSQTFTINPQVNFDYGETCTVSLIATHITDQDGVANHMITDYTWQFTTDHDIPPTIVSTTPGNLATNIALDANIIVNFSEKVHPTGTWYNIHCTISGQVTGTVTGDAQNYTINPDMDFANSETCTITVFATQINDLDGDTDYIAENYSWRFTTVAPIDYPPTIIRTLPGLKGTDVPPNINLMIEFSEGVATAGSWFSIHCTTSGSHSANVSGNDTIYILDPSTDFSTGEDCTVEIFAVGVKDAGGNHLIQNYIFSFSTRSKNGDVPPVVQSISPGNNAMNVARDSVIEIQFSEDVRAQDWIKLTCEKVGPINVNFTTSDAQKFIVTPEAPLSANDTCFVEIIAEKVNDLDGSTVHPMAVNFMWNFSTGTGGKTPLPPAVVVVSPGEGVSTQADTNIVITFSENVDVAAGWYTITCTQSGVVTATQSGGSQTFTINPQTDFIPGENCKITLDASKIKDFDTPSNNLPRNYMWAFNIAAMFTGCGATYTPIYTIQGTGDESPLSGTITTEGVVTADFEGATPDTPGGFYIQDPAGDGDPHSSDGIFVFNPDADVATIGHRVRVQGLIREHFGLTQITNIIEMMDCGQAQSITPTVISLPFKKIPEHYEGMLVTFTHDLIVTDNRDLGQFGNITLSSGDRLFAPTQHNRPGSDANAKQQANNLNRIILDDGKTAQYPDPTPYLNGTLRLGDTVKNLNAILTYGFEAYRLYPLETPIIKQTNSRPAAPPKTDGRLTVASMNLQNYFNGPDFPTSRGADSAKEFTRQHEKILNALMTVDADIVGLMEVENDGYSVDGALKNIVDGLNTLNPSATYTFIAPNFDLGADAIKVAIIYKADVVIPVGNPATTLASPFDNRRPPLAQTFQEISTKEKLTVVVNHFKSRRCGDARGENLDLGQGCWNAERKASAQALAKWLTTDPTGSNDSDILVIGDLNAYALEEPLQTLRNKGYTDLIALFAGERAYTHQFAGESGYLDHALSTSSLKLQITGVSIWHINADEPHILDYNLENKSSAQQALNIDTPYRSSDHDPVIVGLNLNSAPVSVYSDNLTLRYPIGKITEGYGNPVYRWTRLEGATDYQLYIAPKEQLAAPVLYDILPNHPICHNDECTLDPTLTDETTRLTNGTYVVYMRAWVSDQPGDWVGPFHFELSAPPPSPGIDFEIINTNNSRPILLWQLDETGKYSMWFHMVIDQLYPPDQDVEAMTVVDKWVERHSICKQTKCILQLTDDLPIGNYTIRLSSWGPGEFSVKTLDAEFKIGSSGYVGVEGVTITLNQGRPSIIWQHGDGTAWYHVYVGDGEGTLYQKWHYYPDMHCAMTCTFTPNINPKNGTYEIYLQGWGTIGLSNISGAHPFTLAFSPPKFVLPLAITDTDDGRPELSWQGTPGGTWYRLWIGTNAFETHFDRWYLADDLGCEQPTVCISHPASELPNGDYLWFVQAWGPGGFSDWIQGPQFTVNALPVNIPIPASPTGNVKDRNPVFTWAHIPNAIWYELTLFDEDRIIYQQWHDFEMLDCTMKDGCTLEISDLLLESEHFQWVLRAYNPSGMSDYSDIQSFRVLW